MFVCWVVVEFLLKSSSRRVLRGTSSVWSGSRSSKSLSLKLTSQGQRQQLFGIISIKLEVSLDLRETPIVRA